MTNNDSLKPRFNTLSGKKILKNVQSKEAKSFHHRAALWKLSKMTTNRVPRIKVGIQRKPADRTSRPNFVATLLKNLQRFTKMHASFVKIYLSERPFLTKKIWEGRVGEARFAFQTSMNAEACQTTFVRFWIYFGLLSCLTQLRKTEITEK